MPYEINHHFPAADRALLLAILIFQGCNALNPLCRSARPAPVLNSLSATSITFAEVQSGFILTLTGSDILASSVVVINGTSSAPKS